MKADAPEIVGVIYVTTDTLLELGDMVKVNRVTGIYTSGFM
jgi:hypothetical protein